MACVAVSDADDEALGERGYHLAKYLSCCGASQCAETHVCSRRWDGHGLERNVVDDGGASIDFLSWVHMQCTNIVLRRKSNE